MRSIQKSYKSKESNALFLLETLGGSLFKRDDDGQWQWAVECEGGEGRTIDVISVGKTPLEAITKHALAQ